MSLSPDRPSLSCSADEQRSRFLHGVRQSMARVLAQNGSSAPPSLAPPSHTARDSEAHIVVPVGSGDCVSDADPVTCPPDPEPLKVCVKQLIPVSVSTAPNDHCSNNSSAQKRGINGALATSSAASSCSSLCSETSVSWQPADGARVVGDPDTSRVRAVSAGGRRGHRARRPGRTAGGGRAAVARPSIASGEDSDSARSRKPRGRPRSGKRASARSASLVGRTSARGQQRQARQFSASGLSLLRRKRLLSYQRRGQSRPGVCAMRKLFQDEGVVNILNEMRRQQQHSGAAGGERTADTTGRGRRNAAAHALQQLHLTGAPRRSYRVRAACQSVRRSGATGCSSGEMPLPGSDGDCNPPLFSQVVGSTPDAVSVSSVAAVQTKPPSPVTVSPSASSLAEGSVMEVKSVAGASVPSLGQCRGVAVRTRGVAKGDRRRARQSAPGLSVRAGTAQLASQPTYSPCTASTGAPVWQKGAPSAPAASRVTGTHPRQCPLSVPRSKTSSSGHIGSSGNSCSSGATSHLTDPPTLTSTAGHSSCPGLPAAAETADPTPAALCESRHRVALISSQSVFISKLVADKNLNLVRVPLSEYHQNQEMERLPVSEYDRYQLSHHSGPCHTSSAASALCPTAVVSAATSLPASSIAQSLCVQRNTETAGARNSVRLPASTAPPAQPGRVARSSTRSNQGSTRLREISVKKFSNFSQIIMCPVTTRVRSGLNIQVMRELRECLSMCSRDPACRAVLLTSSAGPFCQGLDYSCLMGLSPDKRRRVADLLLAEIKCFVEAVCQFDKPLLAGVTGDCVGLGVALLPLCDLVYVSERVSLRTVYHRLATVPEGAATHTLPASLGLSRSGAMLMTGRCMTGSEAVQHGLASCLLWPSTATVDLFNHTRQLADSIDQGQTICSTKLLLRQSLRRKVREALESEGRLLAHQWCTDQFQSRVHQLYYTDSVLLLQKPGFDTA